MPHCCWKKKKLKTGHCICKIGKWLSSQGQKNFPWLSDKGSAVDRVATRKCVITTSIVSVLLLRA